MTLDEMEQKMISEALKEHKKIFLAATALGISRAGIYRKMRKYGITRGGQSVEAKPA